MFKHVLAAALAAALIGASVAPGVAQAATEKSQKSAKKLTPQQQKMKDCGAKWQEHKKAQNVKGQTEYRKFLSGCLKG
jgi:Ni/Co efflux regulator RcnB